ncbi:hypothetical protein [Streptococcus mutans]|nr:hypothetical protein [Streptococcus mutans]
MGQCIYFDTFGRRERITVDGMFPEMTALLIRLRAACKLFKKVRRECL